MRNLVLTYAGGDVFTADGFWVFVASWKRHVPHSELVVMTDAAPPAAEFRLENFGAKLQKVPAEEMHFLWRDRHLQFWRFLNRHASDYDLVLSTDCRDVVFQADPFLWVTDPVPERLVAMAAEGHTAGQSEFSRIEHFEFERDVPLPYLKEQRGRPVVNGGIFLGTPGAMRDWHFLVWMTTMKSIGRCSDQATVNWLLHYLEADPCYRVVSPLDDDLCLTGEGIKEGAVEPVLEKGVLRNPKGARYRLIHQWDRLDGLREDVLAQYRQLISPGYRPVS